MLRQFAPVILLTISNIFMTFAWYGHLKFKGTALWIVILASWGIALFEYCFQVPANRIGHEFYDAAHLKTMQEVILLLFGFLFERRFEVELYSRIFVYNSCCIFRI